MAKSNTKFLTIIVVIVFILLLIFILLVINSYLIIKKTQTSSGRTSEEIYSYFFNSIQNKYIREKGRPIEGFSPVMLMEFYTGLEEKDFDGVETYGGIYKFQNNKLEFIMDNTISNTSADESITFNGMKTLLDNLGKRFDIVPSNTSQVELIISLISNNIPNKDKINCLPGQRNMPHCIQIYKPVCGYRQIECIRVPCNPVPETFSNSCVACSDERVLYYIEGECS
ncbi:MAG: hypothetical protein QXI33_00410 [Candidatus Pacearchaeota archaeon]